MISLWWTLTSSSRKTTSRYYILCLPAWPDHLVHQLEAQAESRAKVETSPEPEELSCVSPNMMSSVSPPRVDESPVSRPSIIVSRGDFAQLVHFLINQTLRYDATKCSSPHPRLPLQGVEARQVGEGEGGEAQETGSWDRVCAWGLNIVLSVISHQRILCRTSPWQLFPVPTLTQANVPLTWRSCARSRSSGREPSSLSRRRRRTTSTGSREPRTQSQQEGETGCLIFTCTICWVTTVTTDQERREGWRKIRSLCEQLSSRRRTSAWGRMWRKPTLPLRVKRWRLDNVLFHSMH